MVPNKIPTCNHQTLLGFLDFKINQKNLVSDINISSEVVVEKLYDDSVSDKNRKDDTDASTSLDSTKDSDTLLNNLIHRLSKVEERVHSNINKKMFRNAVLAVKGDGSEDENKLNELYEIARNKLIMNLDAQAINRAQTTVLSSLIKS